MGKEVADHCELCSSRNGSLCVRVSSDIMGADEADENILLEVLGFWTEGRRFITSWLMVHIMGIAHS